ncbi:WD40/YVTN/BNR-like repeat-containing protein [Flaviaesturariibacter aridisoli]|uniref:Glycosyl hydrolase n=1 Tax=Flaviaesturariibacter aridisoli TaxID=2545761 RepID=A0A4R4E804_9BACT|nr:glycosyl hydrolase [Flaviaesturariibacter aridisoli]TCZ74970.1 glycosyl hydrolase [Flaviaesturariibacter aridisoli]
MRRPLLLLTLFLSVTVFAQKRKAAAEPDADSALFSRLKFRLAGPFRGGRVAAVAGSTRQKNTFYFGAVGGGVWKTSDGGSNWKNVSDKYFGGSIGAVAVAPSDDNVLYAGEGENTLRGNESEGLNGIWRSDDAGRTWKNCGLKDARHISRILVHPRDPNTAWAAVIGHSFGPNDTRGVYQTTDGGKTWKRQLFVNSSTGAAELAMEPGNPSVLYAGMWRVQRTPWSMESGGTGSGLWRSTDGGATWTNLSARKGLPKGVWGIVGVAVAATNPDKIYALVENEKGGLFVSNDAGETWTLTSSDNNIRQRAWYYSKVFVDPKNENTVYAPNVNFMRSRDGGKTFQSIPVGHGDCHDVWIDPEDGARMILGDDGGAEVSFDGGGNWSTLRNQPTAQIYRVSTDNSFPYRILGAQQDNSTIRLRSRGRGRGGITDSDWEPTAGAESGYVVADPLNPDIVYGGNYGGYLSRLDHRTGENRAVSPWPDNPIGAGADVQKYRFQWNFPIFFSPHNPKRLYCAANVLFATEDEGATWKQLSPDLTTNDKSKQGPSGGPITKDNTSVEYYCTIFTALESPYEKDLLWTGSDDGVISVSRDGGATWANVTPAGLPKWMLWNCVEADPFQKGAAYFVGTRYKLDDFTPYIYKTEDYGKSWKLLTSGIPPLHFTRCLRADPKVPGLLYAGTEYGLYLSRNGGQTWRPFQLNLPETPVTDMTIKDNDLIVATQGRSFYVLDDLGPLQQWTPATARKRLQVFTPAPAYRLAGSGNASFTTTPRNAGANPPGAIVVPFWVSGLADSSSVRAVVLDKDHKEIRSFSSHATEDARKIDIADGFNRFAWNALYPESERIEGMILWNGVPGGILAPPGQYYVRIVVDRDSAEVPATILPDPNYKATVADYAAQFAFLKMVQDKFNETQKALKDIRALRSRIDAFLELQGKSVPKEVKEAADTVQKRLQRIEETLYQTKARSGQDVLNYPIRLNDKLSGLFDVANSGNFAPSRQVQEVYRELAVQIDAELARLRLVQDVDVKRLNEIIREKALPVIGVR